MKLLKAIALGFALSVSALVAAPAPIAVAQTTQSLSGVWQGMYWGEGNTPTSFQTTLRHSGDTLSGSTVETNNFGTRDATFLLATLSGALRGGHVSFVKTYDGTGGQSHSIAYEGDVLSNGRRIVGAWSADGASGRFEMAR